MLIILILEISKRRLFTEEKKNNKKQKQTFLVFCIENGWGTFNEILTWIFNSPACLFISHVTYGLLLEKVAHGCSKDLFDLPPGTRLFQYGDTHESKLIHGRHAKCHSSLRAPRVPSDKLSSVIQIEPRERNPGIRWSTLYQNQEVGVAHGYSYASLEAGSLAKWVECSPMVWETSIQSQVASYQRL